MNYKYTVVTIVSEIKNKELIILTLKTKKDFG